MGCRHVAPVGAVGPRLRGDDGWGAGMTDRTLATQAFTAFTASLGVEDLEGEEGGDYEVGDVD